MFRWFNVPPSFEKGKVAPNRLIVLSPRSSFDGRAQHSYSGLLLAQRYKYLKEDATLDVPLRPILPKRHPAYVLAQCRDERFHTLVRTIVKGAIPTLRYLPLRQRGGFRLLLAYVQYRSMIGIFGLVSALAFVRMPFARPLVLIPLIIYLI